MWVVTDCPANGWNVLLIWKLLSAYFLHSPDMRANRVLKSFLIANISFTVNFILGPNWPLSDETRPCCLFKQSNNYIVHCEALRKTRRRGVSEAALACRYFLQRARCCSNLTGKSETHTQDSVERNLTAVRSVTVQAQEWNGLRLIETGWNILL